MCGIIGIVQKKSFSVKNKLLKSLKRLEYRGYDSWGIAVKVGNKSGDVSVVASNACGTSSVASLAINVACREMDPNMDFGDSYTGDEEMKVYPNPVHDELYVKFNSDGGNYSLRIYDMTGRLVTDEQRNADAGETLIQLKLSVSKGIYIVVVTSGDLNKQTKITVE